MFQAGITPKQVSYRTVQRFLRKEGFQYLQAHKKGILTEKDLKERLKFAQKMQREYDDQFWKNSISFFLDGVSFIIQVRWPKRVDHKSVTKTQNNFPKHKSISQNTNQFLKTRTSLPKHKRISRNTNQFPKTQISFPKHKSISQNTNQFLKTRTSLPKHKPISRNTNQWTGHLLCNYQREPERDSFPGISASNMATSSCE